MPASIGGMPPSTASAVEQHELIASLDGILHQLWNFRDALHQLHGARKEDFPDWQTRRTSTISARSRGKAKIKAKDKDSCLFNVTRQATLSSDQTDDRSPHSSGLRKGRQRSHSQMSVWPGDTRKSFGTSISGSECKVGNAKHRASSTCEVPVRNGSCSVFHTISNTSNFEVRAQSQSRVESALNGIGDALAGSEPQKSLPNAETPDSDAARSETSNHEMVEPSAVALTFPTLSGPLLERDVETSSFDEMVPLEIIGGVSEPSSAPEEQCLDGELVRLDSQKSELDVKLSLNDPAIGKMDEDEISENSGGMEHRALQFKEPESSSEAEVSNNDSGIDHMTDGLQTQDTAVFFPTVMTGKLYTVRTIWAQYLNLYRVSIDEVLSACELRPSHTNSGPATPRQTVKLSVKLDSGVYRCPAMQALVMHPVSRVRLTWVLVSFLLLLYDMFMVPMATCFDLEEIYFTNLMNFVTCIFWSMDIPFNFFTGVNMEGRVEMDFCVISRLYTHSWFVPDICIVCSDWAIVSLEGIGGSSPLRMLRNLRFLRILRLLRLLRFFRLVKFQPFLQELIVLTSEGLHVTMLTLKASCYLLILSHFTTCAWHVIGDSIQDGWIAANSLEDKSALTRYAVAMRWTIGHVAGLDTGLIIKSTVERFADSVIMLIYFVIVCFYIGIVTHTIIVDSASDVSKLKINAHRFVKRHNIGRVIFHRILKFLGQHQVKGSREVLMAEEKLLRALPRAMQEDLYTEARARITQNFRFIMEVNIVFERVMRHLCSEAMEDLLAVEEEVVFAKGDVGQHMYFMRSGTCTYTMSPKGHRTLQLKEPQLCIQGMHLSEAALWTHWDHAGNFVAMDDALCLTLNAAKFGLVISQSWGACVCAVKYARAFTRDMNSQPHQFSDVTNFFCLFGDLDRNTVDNSDRHFIFLSHYKQEAGTEAALMRHALEELINGDMAHPARELPAPVFVDSENLTDLAKLKGHVQRSDALVVLLTNGVLTRPWCLIELVTAFQSDAKIVPVEIQRPGMQYRYPNEDFYTELREGKVINQTGVQMLQDEGVSLGEVEAAVRNMFKKIALPFSPHRAETIRNAELSEILKRTSRDEHRWSKQLDHTMLSNSSIHSSCSSHPVALMKKTSTQERFTAALP